MKELPMLRVILISTLLVPFISCKKTPIVSAPGAFSISSAKPGDAQVTIEWDASTDASTYTLKRGTSSGSHPTTVSTDVTSPFKDTGLKNGTTYYYMVTAVNTGGSTNAKAEASATPTASAPATPATPAPGNFSISDISAGNTQITITWGSSSNSSSYTLKRGSSSGSYSTTVSTSATSPYTDTGLTNGTAYYYMLTATGAGGTTNVNSEASATPTCTAGASWSTVEDFMYTSLGGWVRGMGIDSSRNIYAVGQGKSSGVNHWIVRKSTNSGTSWTTVDDYQYSSGRESIALAFGTDSAGTIYITGVGNDSSEVQHWVVRKTTDGGSNWTVVDDFQYASGKGSFPWAFGSDSSGNIYGAGQGIDSSNGLHWIIRKSANSGSTWSTVDDATGSAQSFAVSSAGVLFATGYDGTNLVVRKSANSGSSWSAVDTFQYASGHASYAFAIGFDLFGNLFTAGQGINSSGIFRWIVRKSTDSGSSWTGGEDYVGSTGAAGANFASDWNKQLYVSGYGPVPTGASHWLVRKSADSGSSWSTIDDYQNTSGQNSYAYGLAVDSSGNVFVGGEGDATGGTPHWIVRRSLCQ